MVGGFASVQLPWSRRPTCRICGRPMAVEVVRYSAPDGEGRRRTWEGVRRYYCPDGCSTGFYDFKGARVRSPSGSAPGSLTPLQAAGWRLAGLFTAGGLVALYLLFMYGVSRMPIPSGWVRGLLWGLITAATVGLAALLVLPPRRAAAPGRTGEAPASETPARSPSQPAPVAAAAETKSAPAGAKATASGRATAGPGPTP